MIILKLTMRNTIKVFIDWDESEYCWDRFIFWPYREISLNLYLAYLLGPKHPNLQVFAFLLVPILMFQPIGSFVQVYFRVIIEGFS